MKRILPIFFLALLSLNKGKSQYFLYWNYYDFLTDLQESGNNPDFIIDNAGTIHVSYWNQREDRLMYARKIASSSQWLIEGVDSNQVSGFKSAIDIRPDGSVAIAYFYSNSGKNDVAYALRSNGIWNIEYIPSDTSKAWGKYGANNPEAVTEKIRHSIDLIHNSNGDPSIVFFNAWVDLFDIAPCGGYYNNYEFRLVKAWKTGGVWSSYPFAKFGDISGSCFGFPVPDGDRFGEHCMIHHDAAGREIITANSFQNNWILDYKNTSGDTTFSFHVTDSMPGTFPCMGMNGGGCCSGVNYSNSYYYTTLESVSSEMDADGNLHLAYTSSLDYGFDPLPSLFGSLNCLTYFRLDSLGNGYRHNLYPGTCAAKPYYSLTSICTHGSDSIFIAVTDKTNFFNLVFISYDGGLTFTTDTLTSGLFPQAAPKLIYRNDSLHAMIYHAEADQLFWHRRALNNPGWLSGPITTSQNRGTYLDAGIHTSGADTLLNLAYTDDFLNKLYFSSGTKNGSLNWVTEMLDSSATGYGPVQLIESGWGVPVLLYHDRQTGNLRMAKRSGGNWIFETIDSAASPAYISARMGPSDTIHIAYYSGRDSTAKYVKRAMSGGSWSPTWIDTANRPTGKYIALDISPSGLPRAAYRSEGRAALMYAEYSDTSGWVTDSIDGDAGGAIGTFCSMGHDNPGRPGIAYRDNFNNILYWIERDDTGAWHRTTLDASGGDNIGAPSEVQYDPSGKPWVMYNYYQSFDQLRLKMRDSLGWHSVSVSTSGRLGNSFSFNLLGNDLFVSGKKNRLRDNGIGILHAENGLLVYANEEIPELNFDFRLYPNPASGAITLLPDVSWPGNSQLRITDLNGRELIGLSDLVPGQKMQVVLKGLSPGVYFAILECGPARRVHRLIVSE